MSCIQSSKAVGSGTKLKSTTVTNAILVHYKTIQREEIQIKTFRKKLKNFFENDNDTQVFNFVSRVLFNERKMVVFFYFFVSTF